MITILHTSQNWRKEKRKKKFRSSFVLWFATLMLVMFQTSTSTNQSLVLELRTENSTNLGTMHCTQSPKLLRTSPLFSGIPSDSLVIFLSSLVRILHWSPPPWLKVNIVKLCLQNWIGIPALIKIPASGSLCYIYSMYPRCIYYYPKNHVPNIPYFGCYNSGKCFLVSNLTTLLISSPFSYLTSLHVIAKFWVLPFGFFSLHQFSLRLWCLRY